MRLSCKPLPHGRGSVSRIGITGQEPQRPNPPKLPTLGRDRKGAVLPLILSAAFAVTLHAEPADWIWTARYVVTMDGQRRILENGAIAIRGNRIVAVGPRTDIDRRFQPRSRPDR